MPEDGKHIDKSLGPDDIETVPVELPDWFEGTAPESLEVAPIQLEPEELAELYSGGELSVTWDAHVDGVHITLSDEVESRPIDTD